MMFSWNLGISYPENLPIDLVYDAIIKTLDTETAIVNSGFLHVDYCSGYAPDCIWKEHCSCLVYWNSNDNDLDDNKEGDF